VGGQQAVCRRKEVDMLAKDIDVFEAKARGLILDAITPAIK